MALEDDIPSILAIINHEILHSTALYDYEERSFEFQLNWFHQKRLEKTPILVVEQNGKLVGFGTYGIFRPKAAYQFSVEHSIYIHHEHQGGGIGKMLMSELIKLAKQEGYHTMIAGIDASNAGSIRFHESFGFVEVGHIKEVGYKFESWLDLKFLQLVIEDKDKVEAEV